MAEMPQVRDCAVRACAYNRQGCHAYAITIGSSDTAHCETYADLPVKGGVDTLARVGACTREDCQHNDNLLCHAPEITVGPDVDAADCLTYAPAQLH
jgi:hypothetical protein